MFKIKASLQARGAGSLFSAAIIQAMYGPLTREMMVMFGTYAQVTFRLGMGFLTITLFNMARRKFLRLPAKSRNKTILLGIVWFCNVSLFTVSVTMTSITTSVFVMYAASIISSLLFGIVLQKERPRIGKLVAVAVAVGGLIMYTGAAPLSVGALAAVGAGVLDGLSNIIRKRLKNVEGYTLLQYQSAVSAIAALLVAVLIPEQSIHQFSAWALWAGVIYGALSLVRNKLLHFGIHHFDTHVGAIILATQLLFATLFGALFYNEIPTLMQLLGGMTIFVAALLCVVRRRDIRRVRARLQSALISEPR
jgi:drug/metabolite transporter (DMT)-like permease